ncbi:MAG: hypothetical protein ACE5GX_17650 [Thermoanaerobaculia bacterium]
MLDELIFLAAPLLATLSLVAILGYLGLHVLKRQVIFVDLALAQIAAFVAWPIEYTIKLNDGRVIQSRGTVTFVLENHGHHFMIRHLHWSSRNRPAPEGG